jgi:DNA mismatch repair protein MutS
MAEEKKKKKSSKGQTPLMRQYWKVKDRHPNAILLFRMGKSQDSKKETKKKPAKTMKEKRADKKAKK